MNIICELAGVADYARPGQGIGDIKIAGFSEISIDLSYIPINGKALKDIESEEVVHVKSLPNICEALWKECESANLEVSVLRSPMVFSNIDEENLSCFLLGLAIETLKLCRSINCKYVVLPPLICDKISESKWKIHKSYYVILEEIVHESQVMILIQNQCYNINGRLVRSESCDALQMAKLIDELNEEVGKERFGFCMDTGVCNLCGQNMHEFALALGKRIKAVILRDCDGQNDISLPPFFTNRTDWLGFIRGMREIEFDGVLISDFSSAATYFPPLLRPQLVGMAKSTAEYMKWQIQMESAMKKYKSIVLFGAGNMCRNYVKCYGEQYPPLFTCDNNKNLWGTEFCGLEVKSPEALKELPPDCGIFICNVYYREIEAQLRAMQIQNPIEFFNDEYMPSFHFDRIKRS